ncbi:MAG: hypothetical protein VKJ02_19155 [Snowella sp.]|nr:hypothetical protein [Snowella sp.]
MIALETLATTPIVMFFYTVEICGLKKSHFIDVPIKISFLDPFLQVKDDVELAFYYKAVNRFHDYCVIAKVIHRQDILFKTTESLSTLINRNHPTKDSNLPVFVGYSRIFIEIQDKSQMQFTANYLQENKHIAKEKISSILEMLQTTANNSKFFQNIKRTTITNFSVDCQVRLVDIFTLSQLDTELKELQKINQSYKEMILIDKIEFLDG